MITVVFNDTIARIENNEINDKITPCKELIVMISFKCLVKMQCYNMEHFCIFLNFKILTFLNGFEVNRFSGMQVPLYLNMYARTHDVNIPHTQ